MRSIIVWKEAAIPFNQRGHSKIQSNNQKSSILHHRDSLNLIAGELAIEHIELDMITSNMICSMLIYQ